MKIVYSKIENPTSIEQHQEETSSSSDLETKELIETIWRGIAEGFPNVELANLRKRNSSVDGLLQEAPSHQELPA